MLIKITHSKKSNLGIIYECLKQEIVESTVQKEGEKRKTLLRIVKKYFIDNKYLSEEYNLFSALLDAEYTNKDDAKRFILECLSLMKNLSKTLLERKKAKQELLEEIKKVTGTDFFDHVINEYVIYSTINSVIDYYSQNRKLNEIKIIIELEKKLLEHVTNNKIVADRKNSLDEFAKLDKTMDQHEIAIAISQIKNKYITKLLPEQKDLLEFFMQCSNDKIIEDRLNKNFKTNYNKVRIEGINEKINYTKDNLNKALNILSESYNNASGVENKLMVVLDSYYLIKENEK